MLRGNTYAQGQRLMLLPMAHVLCCAQAGLQVWPAVETDSLGHLQVTELDEEFLEAVVQVQRLQRRRRNLKAVLQKIQVCCTASFSNSRAGTEMYRTACLNLSGLVQCCLQRYTT